MLGRVHAFIERREMTDAQHLVFRQGLQVQVKKVTGDGAELRVKMEAVVSIVKPACSDASAETVTYGAGLCASLARADNFDASEWSKTLIPLKEVIKGDFDAAVAEILKKVQAVANPAEAVWDEIGEGELCRAEFGLASAGQ